MGLADLQYTLGLDAATFMSAASKAVSVMGSLQLACDLVARAASAMTSSFVKAADMESIEVGIDTITKSAEKTKAVMEDLRKLGAQTPFELKDLAPAAKQLLGAGTAVKDVAKQLKMLGDITSGAGGDLNALVTVFNQVRGAGKLMTQDFMQLVSQGVPGLREEIAKFKGIDTSMVAKTLEEGKVSAADLEQIFVRMTSSGGVFFNAMVKQSATFSGKLSNLADAWSTLQVAFAQPINEALKPLIDDISSLATALTPAFKEIGGVMGGIITDTREFIKQVQGGGNVVDSLKDHFSKLYEEVKGLVAIPWDAIGKGIPELGAALLVALMPPAQWLSLKMEAAALKFVSILQTGMAEAIAAYPFMKDSTGVQTLRGTAYDNNSAAWKANNEASDINLASGLKPANKLLNQGMATIGKQMTEGMNAWKEMIGIKDAPEPRSKIGQAGWQQSPNGLIPFGMPQDVADKLSGRAQGSNADSAAASAINAVGQTLFGLLREQITLQQRLTTY